MNYIFNLMGIPIKKAHNIEFKDNKDGTFQILFTAPFYSKKTNKNQDMKVHILKLKFDQMPLISMLPNENNVLYTVTETEMDYEI